MPISISPTVASININGNIYTHENWENNTPGTLSGLANDIASQITLLELVGILTKAIGDGTTYLTGPESTNIGFVFTGALTAQATVVFAPGSQGIAQIENQTTGGFSLVCSLSAGSILVPPLGSAAALLSTGLGVTLQSGIVRTSTGTSVTGALAVTGAVSVVGAISGSSQILSGNMTVGGNNVIAGSQSVGNNETIAGSQTVSGAINGGSTFNLVGAATIGGAVSVGGAATVGGNLTAGGDLTAINAEFKTLEVYNSGAVESRSVIAADAGQAAWIQYNTGDEQRWLAGRDNTLETGSNAGSDWALARFDDSGVIIDVAMRVKRDTGHVIIFNLPTSTGGLAAGTLWNDTGTVKVA